MSDQSAPNPPIVQISKPVREKSTRTSFDFLPQPAGLFSKPGAASTSSATAPTQSLSSPNSQAQAPVETPAAEVATQVAPDTQQAQETPTTGQETATETATPQQTQEAPTKPGDLARERARLIRDQAKHERAKAEWQQKIQNYSQYEEKIKIIEQGSQAAQRDPIGFLTKAFGVSPVQIRDALLQAGNRTPQQQATQEVQELKDLVTQLREEGKQYREQLKTETTNKETSAYITSTLEPLYTGDLYPHTKAQLGDKAATELHKVLVTKKSLDHQAWAKEVENMFKAQHEKSGLTLAGKPTPATPAPKNTANAPKVSTAQPTNPSDPYGGAFGNNPFQRQYTSRRER